MGLIPIFQAILIGDVIQEATLLISSAWQAILNRNHRVELEKAWEQSTTRVVGIVIITYALMCLIFY